MVPAKPTRLLVPVTSISSPAAKVSTGSSWPTVCPSRGGADLDHVAAGVTRPQWPPAAVTLRPVDLLTPTWMALAARRTRGADLGHDVGARGDDGDRDDAVISSQTWVVPSLVPSRPSRCVRSAHVDRFLRGLISMSTPAGGRDAWGESTVFGVGSMMSMRSLVRAHLEVLAQVLVPTCRAGGSRSTFFSVGSGTGPATLAPVRVTVSSAPRCRSASWSTLSLMRIFCPPWDLVPVFVRCRASFRASFLGQLTALVFSDPAVGRVAPAGQ